MGKKKAAPAPPAFTPSIIYQGGVPVGETKMVNGQIQQHYYPTPAEQERQAAMDARLNELMGEKAAFQPRMSTLDPDFLKSVESASQAYIDKEKADFMRHFQPLVADLRNDAVARFGTTNTGVLDQNLNRLGRLQSDTIANIVQNATLTRDRLKQQELENRRRYWDALNLEESNLRGGLGDLMGYAQLGYNNALQSSGLGNEFQLGIWKAKMQDYMNERARRNGLFSSLFGGIAGMGRMF